MPRAPVFKALSRQALRAVCVGGMLTLSAFSLVAGAPAAPVLREGRGSGRPQDNLPGHQK